MLVLYEMKFLLYKHFLLLIIFLFTLILGTALTSKTPAFADSKYCANGVQTIPADSSYGANYTTFLCPDLPSGVSLSSITIGNPSAIGTATACNGPITNGAAGCFYSAYTSSGGTEYGLYLANNVLVDDNSYSISELNLQFSDGTTQNISIGPWSVTGMTTSGDNTIVTTSGITLNSTDAEDCFLIGTSNNTTAAGSPTSDGSGCEFLTSDVINVLDSNSSFYLFSDNYADNPIIASPIYSFSEFNYSPPIPTYTLSGTVYVDANSDGTEDNGELDYQGATITLSNGQSTTTDSNGNYSFPNLESGTYTENLIVPNGYDVTTTNPISVSLTADTTQNYGIVKQLTALDPATIYISKSLLPFGGKYNLKAEVYKDSTLVTSGEVDGVNPGTGTTAESIPFKSFSPIDFPSGSVLKVSVYACSASGLTTGTATLHYNASTIDSKFGTTIGTTDTTYYLLANNILGTSAGTSAQTKTAQSKCISGFTSFGTWAVTP